jgi:signal transduction histidine kinase
MRSWLGGKGGGLLAFLGIALLVAGGLGWVTRAALRLEGDQLLARAEADLANQVHLALYRLDSRIVTDFAREAGHPFPLFRPAELFFPKSPGKAQSNPALAVAQLRVLPGADLAPWVGQNFLVAPRSDWASPRALRDVLVKNLGMADCPATLPVAPESQSLAAQLAGDHTLNDFVVAARAEHQQLVAAGTQLADELLTNRMAQGAANSIPLPQSPLAQQPQGRQALDRDTALRFNRAQAEQGQQAYANNSAFPDSRGRGDKQVVAVLGPLVPLWLAGPSDDTLAVTRLVQIGDKTACQVTLLDWPVLEESLAEEVRDLLPDVRLQPIRAGSFPHPERAMTALPVELHPAPPMPAASFGWTPLRIGLSLAWAAAGIALLAVGLGGWSLLDLSERRIRFVSAVTHELRTPLTTLRLYLDMLASGMVREEQQKAEYLRTLDAEADRLNRLIGNVLDFSRLEKQRPRLERRPTHVGDLLEHVRSTWDGRCRNAGKDLVVENAVGGDIVVVTDGHLVQQILGNLIDNACKYSHGAPDPRIVVRAMRSPGRLLLEVADHGPGVPAAERRSIFRAFRRGRSGNVTAGGVGLGLALARRWAGFLGGRLTLVTAAEPGGATFRLELPII